jgi:His/Glu/Gln/Arg/opine family amino acid ABC transporter permease subunit
MPPFLTNQKVRDVTLQVLFAGGIVALLVTFAVTAQRTMDAQGMTSGFDFLVRSTGWPISFSLIPYEFGDPYWKALLVGVLNTLFLASIALTLATIVGIFVAAARIGPNPVMNLIGAVYVDVFRNVPLILQVFFWYAILTHLPHPRQAHELGGVVFLSARGLMIPGLNVSGASVLIAVLAFAGGVALLIALGVTRRLSGLEPRGRRRVTLAVLGGATAVAVAALAAGRLPGTPTVSTPALQGFRFEGGITVPPELTAMIVAITIYGGAYLGEVFRAGFLAVGRGQTEAGYSLGLRPFTVFRKIRLPLAIRAIMPTLTGQYVWLLKATTLGIAIGFADFFMVVAVSITQSGQTIELIGILMAGFLIINYSLASVLNAINRAIRLKGQNISA